jgi:hypothetical protein
MDTLLPQEISHLWNRIPAGRSAQLGNIRFGEMSEKYDVYTVQGLGKREEAECH